MRMKVLILEDDRRRSQAMLNRLRERFYTFDHNMFESSEELICYLHQHLAETIAISLDHDLQVCHDEFGQPNDLGTGRDVAEYLAKQQPICPIVIHSTNAHASIAMETILRDSGWTVYRVTPYSDLEWIDELWFPTIRQAIIQAAS